MDNSQARKRSVLIVPLDWGLGHATRCIPIIQTLINQGFNVILAAERAIKILLREEFPDVQIVELKGYRVFYSRFKFLFPLQLMIQVPKLFASIKHEHAWLNKFIKTNQIDLLISDNRYGLKNKNIYSVFITHQLKIKTGLGRKIDELVQKLNYSYISQFNECWVPDLPGPLNLAGELSHPYQEPAVPVKYIGPVSRFHPGTGNNNIQLLIVISGPEPQRTMLEDLLLKQVMDYKGSVTIIRGLPGREQALSISENITLYDHLPAEKLQLEINKAAYIVSRCGYSTVMDIAVLKKKAILIPTPGQPEQEYLANYLMKKKFALCITQNKFKLMPAMELAAKFDYELEGYNGDRLFGKVIFQLPQK